MTTTYPRHAATLAWAEQQIGQREEPPGSNTGPFVRFCQAATWLAGTGWPWCRGFTLRARREAGDTPGDLSAGAWDALERARARGEALGPSFWRKAIPGDEVIWAFGAGHASILKGFAGAGPAIEVITIDGNVAHAVRECRRPISQVKGFIHWPEERPVITPAKPPRAQLVGSASGSRKLVTRKGRKLPLPRVDVIVDGKVRNTGQRPTNPALLKRLHRFIRTARTVTVRRSRGR